MTLVYLLLYIAAGVCFALATAGTITKRVNLVALGLLAWALVDVIASLRAY